MKPVTALLRCGLGCALLLTMAAGLATPAGARLITVQQCPQTATGDDRADLPGIRVTVGQAFDRGQVRMDRGGAGHCAFTEVIFPRSGEITCWLFVASCPQGIGVFCSFTKGGV